MCPRGRTVLGLGLAIEVDVGLEPELGHLSLPQVEEVDHLHVDLPPCSSGMPVLHPIVVLGREVRPVRVSDGVSALFGNDVMIVEDGIGVGLFVPIKPIDDVRVAEFLRLVGMAMMADHILVIESSHR
jgi:hypothetical protein